MTSTLSEAWVKATRSAGLPRRSPGIHSPAPRSSTQRPHCTQSTFAPVRSARARIAPTHSFVMGWSSVSRSCPCTLFSCGVCFAKPRYTAPSYAKTLTFQPRLTARSIRRSAVVVRAFSNGGSMSTKVSVRLSPMGSVPQGLVALAEEIEDVIQRRALAARRQPVVADAPLPEREVVGQHRDTRPSHRAYAIRAWSLARREDAVLDEEQRHHVPLSGEAHREIVVVGDITGLE